MKGRCRIGCPWQAASNMLKVVFCLALWFSGQAFAADAAELLPPEQAFKFTAKVRKADKLLLSWDIANGYYLYLNKFKFVSLTPGITVGKTSFPVSHTKHDATFGTVEIFRDHLEVEVFLQRQDTKLNKPDVGSVISRAALMQAFVICLSKKQFLWICRMKGAIGGARNNLIIDTLSPGRHKLYTHCFQ